MNLKQALYVKTIAEEGGITAAARKLYVSQPSLSQMLRSLEAELGVTLFDRSHTPFRPTFAGERCLHAAAVMLSANEILNNELQEIRQEDSGRLRLGISRQRAALLLPHVLPRFTRQFPHVALELQEAGSANLERMVREGAVDLALAATKPGDPALSYHLIQEETVGILAGEHSLLAKALPAGTPIALDQVREGPFVALKVGHSIRVIQELLFREQNLNPPFYLETDTLETALRVTATSTAYMLCPNIYVPAGSYFYPLAGHRNLRHFYACFRQGQVIPKYMRAFLRMVWEELEVETPAPDGK